MKAKLLKLQRSSYVLAALGIAFAGVLQGVMLEHAYAFPIGGQVQTRSIRISSSAASATGVSYQVSFKPASDYTVRGIIVDFCNSASTPIIGDATCTKPTTFDLKSSPTVNVSPTLTGYTNLGGSWTASGLNNASGYRTLKLESTGGVALDDGVATPYTFVLSGVDNPSTTGTFYARIVTYTSDSGDVDSYAPGTEGSTTAQDYGGFALSTANTISITAKVQESMTFCVSEANPGADCSGTDVPALELGHGANTILDNSQVDTAQAFTQLSTNANGGAIIRMKNSAASGGLNSGTNSIAPAGATAFDHVANTTAAFFGVRISAGTGGTGTITASSPYNDATLYAMDATTSGENVLTTYGDSLASSTAPVNNVENTLTFGARAANTTPAGLYTATITLIATGTF